MWNRPHVLNAIADLLFLAGAAALLATAAVWLVRVPALPIREVVFADELRQVRRVDIEQTLPAAIRGNFFSVNLEAVRATLEKLPWVRKAEVRRVWPARLEVRVEEHEAAARWDDGNRSGRHELVNIHGEVFHVALTEDEAAQLPMLYGPAGTAPELLKRYGEFAAMFRSVGQKPAQVLLSERLAWQMTLDNGTVVNLGREQARAPLGARLQRFLEVYAAQVQTQAPVMVDLRYPNGFAMRVAAAGVKGKQ